LKELSIIIPTYNRNEILNSSIANLINQITVECEIIIIDNSSTKPISETLGELAKVVTIKRNLFNVGGNANIMECIKESSGKFTWILGDDDLIKSDSVKKILEAIKKFPKAVFINFSKNRTETHICSGCSAFIEKIEAFADIHGIVHSVYKTEVIQSAIKFGYHYSYTTAPHIACLLASASEDFQYVLLPSYLIEEVRQENAAQWSLIDCALGISSLVEIDNYFSIRTRKVLAEKISKAIILESIVQQLAIYAIKDKKQAFFIYRQIVTRRFPYHMSIFIRIKVFMYSFLILYPKLGIKLIDFVYTELKKIGYFESHKTNQNIIRDRKNRL
jgi:glycosyltransferase involved in cell wall biosynthesis